MFNKTQTQEQPRAKHYTVPADVNVALLHTIIAVTALRDVLIKETEALNKSKSAVFMDLQDEKVEVARRYETLVNNLMNRGPEIKKADTRLKEQLRRLQDDFSKTVRENLEALERMKNTTSKLAEMIMKVARKSAESQTQFAYGASGKMQAGTKTTLGVEERA